MEAEEQQREDYAFECGLPLWGDALEAEHLDYRLKLLTLREELSKIPDALKWLDLVMWGEGAYRASRKLGKDKLWLVAVQEACRRVLLG